ncbi:rhomboid family intramembrane serine protease [Streptomyces sp. H27-D2]|uniref:rhomboid family intramembrane serine protease n=1 Tax=Streptomyces sp. H27-D2 TaxID=3046304 RepID=UPI002DBDF81A|nr:rhomboid family intramembrane serine protease [Streptomyces sp. H27-D2]MEC4019319.1 rhomboid family intramembrane serine protease [Streptomyces sp. H27-D2]
MAAALSRLFSRVTRVLIGACCLIFALGPASGLQQLYGTGEALLAAQTAYFDHWGVVPNTLWSGKPRALFSPLTALFVHANWLHLLGNVLFLYVFGGMAEERMGRVPFIAFYLLTGAPAMLCYAAVHAGSAEPLVGASGAISAVLGGFLYLFPKARVTSLFPFLFFLPLRFPAWIVLVFWFALQWMAARRGLDGPGVAYLAHVVGFALGFVYAWARYRGDRDQGDQGARGKRRDTLTVAAPQPEGDSQP